MNSPRPNLAPEDLHPPCGGGAQLARSVTRCAVLDFEKREDNILNTQNLVLYHGTPYPAEIECFWPNSHFGSKQASMDSIGSKWVDEAMATKNGELPGSLTVDADPWRRVIEVELKYDVSQCLETDSDWGNPSTIALSDLLRKTPGFEQMFDPIWADLIDFKRRLTYDMTREQRTAAIRSRGEPQVVAALEMKGIKVIKYRNVVEGKSIDGVYEYSYCVFDPSLLNIRKAAKVQDIELLGGIKRALKLKFPSRDFDVTLNG